MVLCSTSKNRRVRTGNLLRCARDADSVTYQSTLLRPYPRDASHLARSDTPIEDDADIENNADTPSDSRNISPSNNDSGMRKSCRTILLPKISSIAAEIEDGFPETLA